MIQDMTYESCIRLVAACFEQAIRDIKNGGNHARDATRWLLSDSTGNYSFLWCCSVLDLDPGRVRDALKNRKAYEA